MKKLITLIFTFFTLTVLASFADVIPNYSTSIHRPGIGAFNVSREFNIYSEPTEASTILKTIRWNEDGLLDNTIKENDLFAVFLPKQNIAYCTVDEEIDGWVKIFYSQKRGKSGWVKASKTNHYVSWLGFYMYFGRKNGVHMFHDIPAYNKKILSAPTNDSQKISDITYPKFIKLTLVRGNFMLVKLLDFGDETKVGWIKWRDNNGKILAFPNMSEF